MKNYWYWIAGIFVGVVALTALLYLVNKGGDPSTAQHELVPTPTNALPDNPERFTRSATPSVTEAPTPTPTPVAEATARQEFVIGDRTSPALTFDGILEVVFQEREYTTLEDYRLRDEEKDSEWEAIYEIPTICTAARFRFNGTLLLEQLGAVKEENVDYYSYFSGNALKRNDTLVDISVPVQRESDTLTLYVRSDEARVMQNGRILAAYRVKDRTVQCLLALDGQDATDYSRMFYIEEDGRPEQYYIEDVDGMTMCYDRRTHQLQWRLSQFRDGERLYCLEVRDPESPEDREDTIVLYRGEYETMPSEVYGVTNTSLSLLDRIEEAESTAKMPGREWEESVHTSLLVSNDFGSLYMDTYYCGYVSVDANNKEFVDGTITERRFRWENPDNHMHLENAVANPDCKIDKRTVIDDPENPARYLLRSYTVGETKRRSRAETPDGELLWVEEAMLADGEPYRLSRSYPDDNIIRVREYDHELLLSEEYTDFQGKREKITTYQYTDEGGIERTETRSANDELLETVDYIYDATGTLVKSMRNIYNADGTLAETITYDTEGNVLPPDAVPPPDAGNNQT
ncbi:MAG: hypothetical protein IK055_08490 [Lachnospiraceae bacterium]|nr:hypothetical protein [Lachnospiraceae bacterium]